MVLQAMGGRWNTYGIKLSYLTLLIIILNIRGCCSLNSEGLALLRFRVKVDSDPYGILENWNSDHCDPCLWSGVQCMDGRVQMLDLHGYSLKGKLAPELGNLTHLKSLVLSENRLFGAIPKEFGRLRMLEVLDMRDNNLSGRIPAVIGDLQSLRTLLICDNNFEGKIPLEIGRLHLLSDLQFDDYLNSGVVAGTGCINRKFGYWLSSIWILARLRTRNMTNMFNLRKKHPSSRPTQSTFWTISPHPIPTHTLSQQRSPARFNIDASQYEGISDKMEKSKLDALQRKMHDLEKKVNGGLNSIPIHDLSYKNLCLHPGVELPSGFKIPKFNMFDGRGDPMAHLKDFCSRLVGLENNEPLLMRLFIQSLSGIAFTWYVKQDFDKWLAWEDMARDFVEQYKFNNKVDPTMLNLLKLKKLSHESFEEYVIRWRMEASKIRHLPHEEELVQTLIRSLEGIYYKTLFFAGIQSFDSLIRIGKELEYGIQSGRIADTQKSFQVLKDSSNERNEDASTYIPPKQRNQNIEQIHAILEPSNPQVSQHKVRKPRVFTPLRETLTDIFQRLWAKGLLRPINGWIPKHSTSNFDLSKNCAYHSNIQGHGTEECAALRNKIQNMIEKGKIIVQQGQQNNNRNPSMANTFIVQGDPTKVYVRHLTRKRKSHQRN